MLPIISHFNLKDREKYSSILYNFISEELAQSSKIAYSLLYSRGVGDEVGSKEDMEYK